MKGFFLFLFLVAPFFALAEGNVMINEIAWMGTKVSASNEWIELANNSQSGQDISGWKLETEDGKMRIILEGKIPAGGFFLLERTDDTTIPEIKADEIYTGSLSNSGEALLVRDKNGLEVDRVDAQNGWTAGDNTTKQTMQRVQGAWITGVGTPRAANIEEKSKIQNPNDKSNPNDQIQKIDEPKDTGEIIKEDLSVPPTQEFSVKPEVSVSVAKEYPKSVYISEFFPDPEGSDEKGEWIELYNDSEGVADIGGFSLDDGEGGSKPYKISDAVIISSKGFMVFNRGDTSIALNNKNDEVRLLYPDGSIAAKIVYEEAPEGYAGAYDMEKKELRWTSKATPGESNILSEKASSAVISNEKAIGQYQEARVAHIEDLPPLSLKDLGLEEKQEEQSGSSSAGPLFWILLFAFILGAAALFGYLKFMKKIKFTIIIVFFLFIPLSVFAETFYVSSELDVAGRSVINAEAAASGRYAIMYVEDGVIFSPLTVEKLTKDFDEAIYPGVTGLLGEPWIPGIDNDARITILLTEMEPGIGGYFKGEDESPSSQNANSNEREMIYLNSSFLSRDNQIRSFLSHEFSHVVSFNQKIRPLEKKEDTWFSEARAEYMPTFLGYDASILAQRVDFFLTQPHDHLITWNNSSYDYGAVNMFSQYLVSRFGSKFFSEEIKTKQIGIPSVNLTLNLFDPALTFAKFFSQWRLANYLNDNSLLNGKYSYKNSKITFTLSPEVEVSFPPGNQPVETFTTTVPTFSAKAVTFLPQGNNLDTTFGTSDSSDDLVVTYIKEFSGGRAEEGQFTLEKGEGMIQSNERVCKITAVVSNASSKIINPRIMVAAEIGENSIPLICSVESVFIKPSIKQNAFSLRGGNFDEGAKLFLNGKATEFIYHSFGELLARIPLNNGDIEVKVVNPGGAEAVFLLKNPLISSVQLSLAVQSSPLIRSQDDYKVYVFQNAFKRHIPDAAIFSFYGHLKNASITVVAPKDINNYTASDLIRRAGDYKVYEVLPSGKKQWIKTAEEFKSRGFDWNAVFEVNEKELTFYPTI